jgi:hypothetical protein
MPFALLFIGMILVVTGFRDTYKQAGSLFVNDLTGQSGGAGFIMFIAAFGMLGAVGTAGPKWRTFSHYFMALIIIALVLHNAGFMQKLIAALKGARASTPVPAATGQSGQSTGAANPFTAISSSLQGSIVSPVQVRFPSTGQQSAGF